VDPNQVDWGYPRGPCKGYANTTKLVSEYYGRLLSWMILGNLTDEYGNVYVNKGDTYQIPFWEVFNEPEGEHGFNIIEYTLQYDAIVKEIRRVADPDHNIQFLGLAMEGRDESWFKYFLDEKNHDPEALPISYISFHYYSSCNSRVNPNSYEQFFVEANDFLVVAESIANIRDTLSPATKIDCDEMGVILPDDNDIDAPNPPMVYWNAAGGFYAYLFAKMAILGYDVLGESQLAGCPVIPAWDIHNAQFPSVSLLNWTTGIGNARYWVLSLLIDNFSPGDIFVESFTQLQTPDNFFCADLPMSGGNVTLKCYDPKEVISEIQFASYGTPTGVCGSYLRSACDALNATEYIIQACVGNSNCTIPASPTFGVPCTSPNIKLVIQAVCTGSNGGYGKPSETPMIQGVIDGKTGNKKNTNSEREKCSSMRYNTGSLRVHHIHNR